MSAAQEVWSWVKQNWVALGSAIVSACAFVLSFKKFKHDTRAILRPRIGSEGSEIENIGQVAALNVRLTLIEKIKRPSGGLSKRIDSVKHLLWHGNVAEALERQAGLLLDLQVIRAHSAAAGKLAAGMSEFEIYIRNNREFIPNFGERYRQGERISTAFVESTINQVVSRRFVKKQQMQWTLRGAHLLLQTRTKVLNNELEAVFRRWYPQFAPKQKRPDPRPCAALQDRPIRIAARRFADRKYCRSVAGRGNRPGTPHPDPSVSPGCRTISSSFRRLPLRSSARHTGGEQTHCPRCGDAGYGDDPEIHAPVSKSKGCWRKT
jgi:hypothetical protein